MDPQKKKVEADRFMLGTHLRGSGIRVLLVIGAIVVILIVCPTVTYDVLTIPSNGSWKQFPSPNKEITQLIVADELGDLYVKGIDGSILVCGARYEQCDEVVEEEINYSDDLCNSSRNFNPPSPPGIVRERLEVNLCGPDVTLQVNYVLLNDGTIWEWTHSWGWGKGLVSVMLTVAIAAVIFIGGVIWLLLWNLDTAKTYRRGAS